MKHHDRGLVLVLIAALFSLASLQGLNLLLRYSSSDVLGDTASCKNNFYQCTTDSDCCSGYCNPTPGHQVCTPRPVNALTTLSTASDIASTTPRVLPGPALGRIPCEEISRLQQTYCAVGVTTSPIITPLPIRITPLPTRIGITAIGTTAAATTIRH